jgi:ankyrin repeat protein
MPLITLLQSRATHLIPCVRKLVAAGAHTSGVFGAGGLTPLATAVRVGNADAVRFLLAEVGVSVDEPNPVNRETALHVCSKCR